MKKAKRAKWFDSACGAMRYMQYQGTWFLYECVGFNAWRRVTGQNLEDFC